MRTESYEANHISLQNIYDYYQPHCLALLWRTEQQKTKNHLKNVQNYMLLYEEWNCQANLHLPGCLALLWNTAQKNENQLKKRNIWNIHHIKKLFWQIYCLLCPAGRMVKKKKVKMIWLSSQPQLTNNPTQLRTTIDLNYFWLTPCASFKKNLYLNLYL